MKVCYVTHNIGRDNGGGVLSSCIIEGVQKSMNVEVIAITSVDNGFAYEKPLLSPGAFYSWATLKKVRAIFQDFDIIHVFDGYPYAIIAYFAAFGLRKKIVITLVGSGSVIRLYSFPFSLILKYVYRKAHVLTAISTFTKKEVEKRVNRLKIDVVTPGVDAKKYIDNTTLSRKYVSLPPYILSVGSLRWRKGYKYTISGFAQISAQFPHLKYVIVGKKYTDKEYMKLTRLIQDMNLEGKVIILDSIDNERELKELYNNAELFCLLSQNVGHDIEGFGIVFLEAAAAGVPVVGSKDCGVEDAVQDGKNGVLVKSDDVQGFVDTVVMILNDSKKKKEMSKAGTEWATKNDWHGKIEMYCQIYRSLVK